MTPSPPGVEHGDSATTVVAPGRTCATGRHETRQDSQAVGTSARTMNGQADRNAQTGNMTTVADEGEGRPG